MSGAARRLARRALLLCSLAALGATAQAADSGRTYVHPDGYDPKSSPPFSNGLLVGGTFYVAGHIGIDPATGQAAADPDTEAHLVLDAVKQTLAKGGLRMSDLVSVTIYCTDLALYDKFNAVYKTYFTGEFPPRAFIGVNKLVRSARFEIAAVAVKSPLHSPKQ
jgi:2-iminobutanoate/2-iminopropanoate deaminase